MSAECEGTSKGRELRRSQSMDVRRDHYHLLLVEDGLEPEQVQRLEWHQDHESSRLVLQSWVSDSRLGVEEPHGGLAPNVGLIPSHRRIVEPEVQMKYSTQVEPQPPHPTKPHCQLS